MSLDDDDDGVKEIVSTRALFPYFLSLFILMHVLVCVYFSVLVRGCTYLK